MITLKEAIERLQARVEGEFPATDPENVDDMKLGIEALERIEVGRNNPGTRWNELLPGEAKE